MADIIDVQSGIVTLAAAALYPNGTGQPSVANAVPCKVYAGWPAQSQLDADLAAATPIAHVTVFPRDEERNTTRFSTDWLVKTEPTPTITLAYALQAITVGGAMPSPFAAHNLAVKINGEYYVYALQAGDTLAIIAAALATLIAVDLPGTTSLGPVITVAAGGRIEAVRVGSIGTNIREIRRQERVFQITIWAATPSNRDSVAAVVDVALASINFLTMPDGFAARIIYRGSPETDSLQKAKLYRRDLLYSVEYATTQTDTGYQVTQATLVAGMQTEDVADEAAEPVGTITINL
jgi:hypothetical protein